MRLVPLLALLALSTPAIAQQTPAGETAAQQQPEQKEKQVCRRYNTTGSIHGTGMTCIDCETGAKSSTVGAATPGANRR